MTKHLQLLLSLGNWWVGENLPVTFVLNFLVVLLFPPPMYPSRRAVSPSSTSNLALGYAKALGQPAHSQQGQPWKLDPKDGGEHWPEQGRVGLWSGFSRAGAETEERRVGALSARGEDQRHGEQAQTRVERSVRGQVWRDWVRYPE